jgi:predicted nucleic acid-binding protein
MKLVLDSSVALKCVLPEEDSDKAVAIRDGSHQLLAPDIFPLELTHVLSKLVRQHKITEDDANSLFVDVLDTRPALKNSMRRLRRAFEISLETRCALWDALYVALSEEEECPLLTADEKLVNNLRDKFNVIALSSM